MIFGRKNPAPGPDFGLADLGGLRFDADGPAPEPVTALPPADVPAAYAAQLPDLRPETRGELTVWRAPLRPDHLGARWAQLRDRHGETGLWPVLVTADFWERWADEELDTSDDEYGSGAGWLGGRYADGLAEEIIRRPEISWRRLDDVAWDELLGTPDAPGEVVLVPAAASWQVPGILGWDGAINEEILGPEHAAVLRRWAAAYGCELVLLQSDILGLRVAAPPATREAAVQAAVEAVAYCPDALFQGADSLEALAITLSAPLWQFWWD